MIWKNSLKLKIRTLRIHTGSDISQIQVMTCKEAVDKGVIAKQIRCILSWTINRIL